MGDSETEYIVELQPKIADRLAELGFTGNRAEILVHSLAEIASRSRTLEQHALPLFLSLDMGHRPTAPSANAEDAGEPRRLLAEVTVALKNHLDAMQDAITDVRPALSALVDFLLREEKQ